MRATVLLACVFSATNLQAQGVEQSEITRARATTVAARPAQGVSGNRSPGLARSLSIVPGLGHVYAGRPLRGLAFTGAFLGAVATTALAGYDCVHPLVGNDQCSRGTETVMYVAAAAIPVVWIASAVDAGNVARRRNNGRKASLVLGATRIPVKGEMVRAVKIGVRLAN